MSTAAQCYWMSLRYTLGNGGAAGKGPELRVGLKGDEIHPQGINIWSVNNILTQNFIFLHYNDANPRSHYACFYTKT